MFVAESLKLPARVWRELFGGFAELDHADRHAERPKRFAADVAAFSRCSAGLQLSR